LIVVSALSFIIPKVGVAPAVILLVLGQLVVGATLDHLGLLGAEVRPLTYQRVLGLLVVMVGVWLSVR
jgi:transporter family-2 protein